MVPHGQAWGYVCGHGVCGRVGLLRGFLWLPHWLCVWVVRAVPLRLLKYCGAHLSHGCPKGAPKSPKIVKNGGPDHNLLLLWYLGGAHGGPEWMDGFRPPGGHWGPGAHGAQFPDFILRQDVGLCQDVTSWQVPKHPGWPGCWLPHPGAAQGPFRPIGMPFFTPWGPKAPRWPGQHPGQPGCFGPIAWPTSWP